MVHQLKYLIIILLCLFSCEKSYDLKGVRLNNDDVIVYFQANIKSLYFDRAEKVITIRLHDYFYDIKRNGFGVGNDYLVLAKSSSKIKAKAPYSSYVFKKIDGNNYYLRPLKQSNGDVFHSYFLKIGNADELLYHELKDMF